MRECPLCGGIKSRSVLKDSPFYRCRSCGTIFNTAHQTLAYNDSYFTTDYREQYGKTYEEDFPAIYHAASRRVDRILSLWKKTHTQNPMSVLDIGCALGFFLKAAADKGYSKISGLEISEFASGRAQDLFGYSIIRTPFEKADVKEKYDTVTAWYFMEHSFHSKETLEKIISLVAEKGVLAFSVPSVYGPTYLLRRDVWAKTHPPDHRIDLSPRAVKRILKKHGFTTVRVYPAGIHANRVLSEKNPLFKLFVPLYRVFSQWTAFSDTLEVYALKD